MLFDIYIEISIDRDISIDVDRDIRCTILDLGFRVRIQDFYNDAIFANQQGDLLLLPPPDPKLTMNKTNKRNIKYL